MDEPYPVLLNSISKYIFWFHVQNMIIVLYANTTISISSYFENVEILVKFVFYILNYLNERNI